MNGQRTCVGCRKVADRATLLRIVRTADGPAVDTVGNMPGRGAYACSSACFKNALDNGRLARALRMGIPENIFESLAKAVEGNFAASAASNGKE